jgi:hypothetical protein
MQICIKRVYEVKFKRLAFSAPMKTRRWKLEILFEPHAQYCRILLLLLLSVVIALLIVLAVMIIIIVNKYFCINNIVVKYWNFFDLKFCFFETLCTALLFFIGIMSFEQKSCLQNKWLPSLLQHRLLKKFTSHFNLRNCAYFERFIFYRLSK